MKNNSKEKKSHSTNYAGVSDGYQRSEKQHCQPQIFFVYVGCFNILTLKNATLKTYSIEH